MISAAAATLLSQTSLALLSNQGDLGKTFKCLGSKQTLCALGMSVASAGALGGAGLNQPVGFQEHLLKNVVNTASSAGGCALQGEKLQFKKLALSLVVNTVAGMIANRLGQGHYDGELDYASHKALHAALGAAMGAALSEGSTSGAIAGAIGGMVAEIVDGEFKHLVGAELSQDLARLASVATALFADEDVDIALATATNALDNNSAFEAFLATAPLVADELEALDNALQKGKEIGETDIEFLKEIQENLLNIGTKMFEESTEALKTPGLSAMETMGHLQTQAYGSELMGHAHNIPTTYTDATLTATSLYPGGQGPSFTKKGAGILKRISMISARAEASAVKKGAQALQKGAKNVGERASKHHTVAPQTPGVPSKPVVASKPKPNQKTTSTKKTTTNPQGRPQAPPAAPPAAQKGQRNSPRAPHPVAANNNSAARGQGVPKTASMPAQKSRVKPINQRMPINAEYANSVYPLEKLSENLRRKYPHSVPFTGTGHPDFSRYAIKKVKIEVTGNHNVDFASADKAAGLAKRPLDYTWHHHHDGKTMLLVPRDIHKAVKHTGGVAVNKQGK